MFSAFARAARPRVAVAAAAGLTVVASAYDARPAPAACSGADVAKASSSIRDVIAKYDGELNENSSITGTLVRLAWHASGTYTAADDSGGSNGSTMRYNPECNWGANAGLSTARDALEPVKAAVPGLSYADIWTLAGKIAVEEAGGPTIPWAEGRTDRADPGESARYVAEGRLPDADKGCAAANVGHLRDIFHRMGFDDKEIVALSGAHALGRCHEDRSGYWGPWTYAETTLSNEYFRLLVEEKWTAKTTHKGKKWTGPLQYENSNGDLMMLPSDVALLQDPAFKKHVEAYARDEALFFADFAAAFGKLLALGTKKKKKGGWW